MREAVGPGRAGRGVPGARTKQEGPGWAEHHERDHGVGERGAAEVVAVPSDGVIAVAVQGQARRGEARTELWGVMRVEVGLELGDHRVGSGSPSA